MEIFMSEGMSGDHVSVGMRKPNGEYERPIPETRLFRTKPGNTAVCSYLQQTVHLLSNRPLFSWIYRRIEDVCQREENLLY